MRVICIAALAAFMAGCGGASDQQAPAAKAAASLKPGEYALSWSKVERQSSEKKTAAAAAAEAITSAAFPERACVAAGGVIDPVAFAERGDSCRPTNSYVRSGTLNVQLACDRKGQNGPVMQMANGTFSDEGFEADVATSTYFAGPGNYTMTRKVTAKRVGECAAKES